MRTIIVFFATALALTACGSNADMDGDGTVTPSEFCSTEHTIECQIFDVCGNIGELGYETLEQCYDGDSTTCSYYADRCAYDEELARACITAASARASSCEPDDGNWYIESLAECENVFSACNFGE
jgi:MoaA/NifB/PqqE/SkfB family radical SAM enzyme